MGQVVHKLFVLNRSDSMSDSLGVQNVNRVPNRFRANVLSGVGHGVEAVRAGLFKYRAKILAGAFLFRSAQTDSDNRGRRVAFHKLVVGHRVFKSKCARNVNQKLYVDSSFFFDFVDVLGEVLYHLAVVKAFFHKGGRGKKGLATRDSVPLKVAGKVVKNIVKVAYFGEQVLDLQESLDKAVQIFISKKGHLLGLGHFLSKALFIETAY